LDPCTQGPTLGKEQDSLEVDCLPRNEFLSHILSSLALQSLAHEFEKTGVDAVSRGMQGSGLVDGDGQPSSLSMADRELMQLIAVNVNGARQAQVSSGVNTH
jgi:hypothetical protein